MVELTAMDKVVLSITIVMFISAAALGAAVVAFDTGGNVTETNSTTTPQAVDESEVPQAARDSYDGAKALKSELRSTETYNDAKVYVTKRGEVVVVYTSDAQYGSTLKEEMTNVAMVYSDIVVEHPGTGGLTVAANGVELLVSSDAALAHGEDRLKDDAYAETFVWKTHENQTTSDQ